jgi:Hydantoinase B/oxoprolinase
LRAGDSRGDHQGIRAGLSGPGDGRLGPPLSHRDPGPGPARQHPRRQAVHLAFLSGAARWRRLAGGRRLARSRRWQAAGGIKFGSLEVTEVRFPLFFRRHEFRPDSGGTGKYRGGPGGVVEMVVETAEPAVGNTAGDGVRYGACGILGGADGVPHRYTLYSGGKPPRAIKTKEVGIEIHPGDVLVLESGGGGGWGDPTLHSSDAAAHDIENGFVTAQGGE